MLLSFKGFTDLSPGPRESMILRMPKLRSPKSWVSSTGSCQPNFGIVRTIRTRATSPRRYLRHGYRSRLSAKSSHRPAFLTLAWPTLGERYGRTRGPLVSMITNRVSCNAGAGLTALTATSGSSWQKLDPPLAGVLRLESRRTRNLLNHQLLFRNPRQGAPEPKRTAKV